MEHHILDLTSTNIDSDGDDVPRPEASDPVTGSPVTGGPAAGGLPAADPVTSGSGTGANGAATAPPDRIASLEAELADWQRRAVVWRERALSAQGLNAALSENLEDLRAMLQLRSEADTDAGSPTRALQSSHHDPAEPWWNKVFRRETWTSR